MATKSYDHPTERAEMPSWFAKFCYAGTAVAPAFGAAAIVAYFEHGSVPWCMSFMVVGLLCVAISGLHIHFMRKRAQKKSMAVVSIEQADGKALEFLLAYLLPVFSSATITDMSGSLVLTAYSLAIVMAAVLHGNFMKVNPVLACFGYHFYVVKSDKGIEYLLISDRDYHKSNRDVQYKNLDEYILLDVSE